MTESRRSRIAFFAKLFALLVVTTCLCTFTYDYATMHFRRRTPQLPCNITNDLQDVIDHLSKEIDDDVFPAETLQKFDKLLNRYFAINHELDQRNDQNIDVCTSDEGHDDHFYQGRFNFSKCKSDKPIEKLVTVVMNDFNRSNVGLLVRNFRELYPSVPIVFATSNPQQFKGYDVKTVNISSNVSLGNILNDVVKNHVSTKYVLIARDLYDFHWFSSLERSVSVLSNVKGVKVVGGAYRNETDHWRVGCYQMKAKNYFLHFTDGYARSTGDCMVCDHLSSSFVTTKEEITKNPFDERFSKSILYQSWFLNLKIAEKLAVSCPDIMYFQSTTDAVEVQSDKKNFLPLARQWKFDHIRLPDGQVLKYQCAEIDYTCKSSLTKYYATPTCCKLAVGQSLQKWNDFCEKHNIIYETDTGTSLGSLKARGLLPYDIDIDLIYLKRDYPLIKKYGNELGSVGLHPAGHSGWNEKYCQLVEHGFIFELWGENYYTADLYLPKELSLQPTKVYFDGAYLHGAANPGLYGRNRYDENDLKHSQSWSVLKMKNSFAKYKSGGSFLPCENPKHHSCLDKFPADGNIPFFLDLS
ncbi:Uncharacterised protein g11246 [Pycnogonum litorale]